MVLGGGLEPPCLSAYAPQTYVSAIPPPEHECVRSSLNLPQKPRCRKSLRTPAPALAPDRNASSVSMSMSTTTDDWMKVDLHIHTLEDPKDVIDYSAHQLLARAKALGFGVLAITLHDAVFDRAEVFADAASMGILLIPAIEHGVVQSN